LRIQHKLFLALLGTCITLIAAVMLLVQWSFTRGMVDYLNNRHLERGELVAELLAEQYQRFGGSWLPFAQEPRLLTGIIISALGEQEQRERKAFDKHGKHGGMPPSRPIFLRLQLLDAERRVVTGRLPGPEHALVPIRVETRVVGWLAVPQLREVQSGFERHFLQQQRMKLLLIGGAAIAVAALIALLLARHLVRPIRLLNRGTHELTQGNYTIGDTLHLPVERRDELGELARDFNELARTLAANDNSRKRWLADISHELRTPLAILRGEIEAMLDGVRPLDRDHLQSVQQEVAHLTRLVDDLHALTTADIGGLQYRKADCDVAELWREVCEAHAAPFAAAGLTLRSDIPDAELVCYGDESRLRQLLDNLLDNSRKYTANGGLVQVSLRRDGEQLLLTVEDSAPGVPAESLPRLFDHLYRVEDSRNRSTGGSGLGLAICQRIVAAHGGAITAAASAFGGLRIDVVLPMKG
jgi:two-component system sensor histidine kinase BaeS